MPNRAPDFKYVFTNALGMTVSDNDCRIIFGIEESANIDDMYEQVAVAMTLKTTKLLAKHLSTIIEHMEKISGQEIPFDEDKQASLLKALNSTNADPTAS